MQSYTQNPSTENDYQEVYFTFSRPVKNLTFTITDIDNEDGADRDHVTLTPAPTGFSAQTNVLGDGHGTAWHRVPSLQKVDNDKGGGNVSVRYDEAQTVVLRFWNGVGSRRSTHDGAHGIFVTKFEFEANTCV